MFMRSRATRHNTRPSRERERERERAQIILSSPRLIANTLICILPKCCSQTMCASGGKASARVSHHEPQPCRSKLHPQRPPPPPQPGLCASTCSLINSARAHGMRNNSQLVLLPLQFAPEALDCDMGHLRHLGRRAASSSPALLQIAN